MPNVISHLCLTGNLFETTHADTHTHMLSWKGFGGGGNASHQDVCWFVWCKRDTPTLRPNCQVYVLRLLLFFFLFNVNLLTTKLCSMSVACCSVPSSMYDVSSHLSIHRAECSRHVVGFPSSSRIGCPAKTPEIKQHSFIFFHVVAIWFFCCLCCNSMSMGFQFKIMAIHFTGLVTF